jgi:rod shape-determining protein MreB
LFTEVLNNLTTTFYIQIWKKRFKVTNLKSGNVYEDLPLVAIQDDKVMAIGQEASIYPNTINPFNHPRMIVDDSEIASILFRYALEQASQKKVFFSPLGIIHVMDEFDTKLTEIEKKALIEISMTAGCRESIVYEGKDLDVEKINFNELKKLYKK